MRTKYLAIIPLRVAIYVLEKTYVLMEVFGNFRRIQQNSKLFSLTALIAVVVIAIVLSPSSILLGAFNAP